MVHPDAAARMKPFLQAEITEFDHAYIMASLKVADGQKAEARALLTKVHPAEIPPSWQKRFETLQTRLAD